MESMNIIDLFVHSHRFIAIFFAILTGGEIGKVDFMPDREFHRLFNRISKTVSLKGCTTKADINRRILIKEKQVLFTTTSDPFSKVRAYNKADDLRRLRPGFASRVIDEAHSNPYGKIAFVLKHGWKKGQIAYKQTRKRLGFDRKWKRKRR